MTHTRWARLGLLLIIVLIWALPASSYEENVVTFKGTVFAVDSDSNGNVIAVSILDVTGEEYFVIRDEIGDKLLKLVDKNLKATGVLYKDEDGKKRIKVLKFDIVGS